MERRLGIGATSAAAVVFSVILLSNLLVFAASENRTSLYSQADASDLLGDEATALTGAAATNILAEVQSVLSGRAMNCLTASGEVSAAVASMTGVQREGVLAVTIASREVTGVNAVDNLSILTPFNGSLAGDLTLELDVSAKTVTPLDRVSLDRDVTHFVHLPVRLDAAVGDCLGAVASISRTMSAVHLSNCTTKGVGPIAEKAASGPAASAGADGFNFGFKYSVVDQDPCQVKFQVTIEQTAIQGPSGSFSLLLAGEGGASFA